MDYRGLICVVTDASTGIGREIALQLARRGGTVVGVARGRDNLEASSRTRDASPARW